MNRNYFRVFKILAWLLVVLGILVLVVFPLVTSRLASHGKMPFGVSSLIYIEMIQTWVMRSFGVVWIFFLGSCFASFLNVVAWRIPRGRGINGSSHCPFCNTKLKFQDNLPVIGWLRNSGRCSTCRLPISPRYLIVEIVLGAVFLLITSVELLAGGWNLPLREPSPIRGFEFIILDPPADLIHLAAYHLVLICALFTFVLIRLDKFKIPLSVYVTALGFGITLPLIWPDMLLVPWHMMPWHIGSASFMGMERFSIDQALTLITGIAGGAFCAAILNWAFHQRRGSSSSEASVLQEIKVASINESFAGLSLVGLFLGWQSALSVLILFCIASVTGARFSVSTRIFVATLVHLLLWRWLTFWLSVTG